MRGSPSSRERDRFHSGPARRPVRYGVARTVAVASDRVKKRSEIPAVVSARARSDASDRSVRPRDCARSRPRCRPARRIRRPPIGPAYGAAVTHEHAHRRQGQHVAAVRLELLVRNLDERPPAPLQLLDKRHRHQRQVDDRQPLGDRADERHQMQALAGTSPVRQIDRHDVDAVRRQQLAQLPDAFVVRAIAAADGQRALVEPERVAALDRPRRLDPSDDRDAQLPVASVRRGRPRVVADLCRAATARPRRRSSATGRRRRWRRATPLRRDRRRQPRRPLSARSARNASCSRSVRAWSTARG